LHHVRELVDGTLHLIDSSALEANVALHAVEFPTRDMLELRSRCFGHLSALSRTPVVPFRGFARFLTLKSLPSETRI
jgi:hypothetical protein